MMEGGFQNIEMEMRPQKGKERPEHVPWGRRRKPRDNSICKKPGSSWKLSGAGTEAGPRLWGPLCHRSPWDIIDTPETFRTRAGAAGPRICHKHSFVAIHGPGDTRANRVSGAVWGGLFSEPWAVRQPS